jgi:hypothetical protein
MYEYHVAPLPPIAEFYRRVVRNVAIAVVVLVFSLGIGMIGYHVLEGLGWTDAYLNAAMLMGGMGPVDPPKSEMGKLFAGTYALYCGLVLLIVASVVLAPLVHRFLHKFHLDHLRKK